VRSPECGGGHLIPLGRVAAKRRLVKYCNVDMLVRDTNEVKLVIEIEESKVDPCQILGKAMTSTLSDRYVYQGKRDRADLPLSLMTGFIQVVSTEELPIPACSSKRKSTKPFQWADLEDAFRSSIVSLPGGKVKAYRLLYGDRRSFQSGTSKKDLQDAIVALLFQKDMFNPSYA
jgi:hypothetical protein